MTIPRLVHPFLPLDHLLNYGMLLYVQHNSDDPNIQFDGLDMYVHPFPIRNGTILLAYTGMNPKRNQSCVHSLYLLSGHLGWMKGLMLLGQMKLGCVKSKA